MHTLSTRTLHDLAYDRGEEYDPALTPTPALMEELSLTDRAERPIEAHSPYERRRRRERERREAEALVPDWFALDDLFERPVGVHGELV
jgi:hypothetical protein